MKSEKIRTIDLVSENSDSKSRIDEVLLIPTYSEPYRVWMRNGKRVRVVFQNNGLIVVTSYKGNSAMVSQVRRYIAADN